MAYGRELNGRQRQFTRVRHTLTNPFANAFIDHFVRSRVGRMIAIFVFFNRSVFNSISRMATRFAIVPLNGNLHRFFINRIRTAFGREVNFDGRLRVTMFGAIIGRLRVIAYTVNAGVNGT